MISSHPSVSALVAALGLPKYTRKLMLEIEVDQPVMIRCEYYPGSERVESLAIAVAEFELVPKKAVE